MKPPTVIGIGNPLRQDDGVGRRAVELLESNLKPGDAEILVCHQLTPELAAILDGAPLVVFFDAATDVAPGDVVQSVVQAAGSIVDTHHLTPAQLLALAREVYNATPEAVLITGGVFETNGCDSLTEDGEVCAGQMAARGRELLAHGTAMVAA